ncbi:MAG: MltA domain-containing protein [Betaproteobacteria bacterium]|nr:MltA domain-containing protein [Betaproteobacteria bacterium]
MARIQTRTACLLAAGVLLVAGCETPAPRPPVAAPPSAPVRPPDAPKVPPAAIGAQLRAATWDELPGWRADDPAAAWPALLRGCAALKNQEAWVNVCAAARQIERPDREAAWRFFERHFAPFQVLGLEGDAEGLVTGYYEPLLRGSRRPSPRYRHPVYAVPDDLLVIDLTGVHPELAGMRLRGRLDGRRVVPYHDRAAIERGDAPVRGKEIVWVDDAIELFFLQIQGSGRIQLDDGRTLRVGFADQNGHPYRSIGRWLIERGELPPEQASMQSIKDWARRNPDQLADLLNYNARYIFFRELPDDLPGPIGALGVPLTAERSVAIDPGFIPLGAPVYLATTWPNSVRPLNRLMLAQDTGGAIRGAVRADFFWGFGEEAAQRAGRMKQALKMWVVLPNGYPLPSSPQRARPGSS